MEGVNPVQCSKRKIILNAQKGGIGNKLNGVLSAILLALVTYRTVEIEWDGNYHLFGSFTDFFVTSNSSALRPLIATGTEPVGSLPEFFVSKYDAKNHGDILFPHSRCHVDFSQPSRNNDVFWLMRSDNLLTKLDKSCDIIRMKSNNDITRLLYEPSLSFNAKLRKNIPRAFHDVFAKGILRLKPHLIEGANKFKAANDLVSSATKKWAAVHVRGLFDADGKASMVGLQCAKALVDKGLVQKIFLATEQSKFIAMARSMVAPENLISYEQKTFTLSMREMGERGMLQNLTRPLPDPSYMIRNESDTAFIEWILLGDADYCMTTTPTSSTYSITAFLRSNCVLLDAELGSSCADSIAPATYPLTPRTHDPEMYASRRKVDGLFKDAINRYFAQNLTCDSVCEDKAWKTVHYTPNIDASKSKRAIEPRMICERNNETNSLVANFWT